MGLRHIVEIAGAVTYTPREKLNWRTKKDYSDVLFVLEAYGEPLLRTYRLDTDRDLLEHKLFDFAKPKELTYFCFLGDYYAIYCKSENTYWGTKEAMYMKYNDIATKVEEIRALEAANPVKDSIELSNDFCRIKIYLESQ